MRNAKGQFIKGHKLSIDEITGIKKRMKGNKYWENAEKQTKEKHWNWKGGLTNLQKKEKIAGRKRPDNCELCGRGGIISFDHDHKTGKFRGWLCGKCNSALGLINEDINTLELMIEYIKKSSN